MSDKILVVDDDAETLKIVGLMLQRQGYQILSAQSGTQALTVIQNERPDLIVLDVMMPDLDGFAVTKQLRDQPGTSDIPILLFTAKNQVDDKITGYESGADDYLTKPVHPAELIAHIKALLSRRRSAAPDQSKGYVIGVIEPSGGMGASTLVLNLAVLFHQVSKAGVIAAEMHPTMGSWSTTLGLTTPTGNLASILRRKPEEIFTREVEEQLTRTTYGIKVLLSSNVIGDADLVCATPQYIRTIQSLSQLVPLVILDIGAPSLPGLESILEQCNEILVITEALPEKVQRTRALLDQITNMTIGKTKLLNLVVINRQRVDLQMSIDQIRDSLKLNPVIVLPSVPEQSYQAMQRSQPIIHVLPDSLFTKQIVRLAENLTERVPR